MGKMEGTIKSEILRLAKREVRAAFLPLRREVWAMRLKLSGLSKEFAILNRQAKELRLEEAKPKLEASPEKVKTSRLTPERIRNLRKKKGLSQRELALITGVTTGAVLSWEKGKFKPKGDKKVALVALRKVNKRDLKKMLAEKIGGRTKAKPVQGKGKKLNTKRRSRM
jgi:DNA-binding transcriptional regulator YiaG